MRELSLHILDLAQNSLRAGAGHISLSINENENGYFVFRLKDDGCGMSSAMLQKVRDPFVTTRTTRKVGMGIPFMDMVAQQCGGRLDIISEPGKGTEIAAYFEAGNIDRPPLGDIAGSIKVLLAGAPHIKFDFTYSCGGRSMSFSTEQVREILGEACDFTNPEICGWIEGYLRQETEKVRRPAGMEDK